MTQTIEPSLSLGQQLRTGREALGLSIDEVAQKTNLKKNHIDSFEKDIFILPNVPPAFVRGYVRNYIRFLRLPEALIGSVDYGEAKITKEVKKVAPIKVKNHKSQTRWVKTLTWLVLLGAVGMTLAWWWQEHKKDQASREQLIVNTIAESKPLQAVTSSSENANTVALNLPVATNNDSVNTESANVTAPSVAPVQEPTSPALPQAVEQPQVTQPAEIQPAQTETIAETTVVNEPEAQVNVLQQSESNTTEGTVTESDQTTITEELRIEITGPESWITVRGAQNKRLAEKLYKSGEVLSFNDNEQYRLTVGAPANVKIYYKGQLVPLKVDGRVARFKLPLAN